MHVCLTKQHAIPNMKWLLKFTSLSSVHYYVMCVLPAVSHSVTHSNRLKNIIKTMQSHCMRLISNAGKKLQYPYACLSNKISLKIPSPQFCLNEVMCVLNAVSHSLSGYSIQQLSHKNIIYTKEGSPMMNNVGYAVLLTKMCIKPTMNYQMSIIIKFPNLKKKGFLTVFNNLPTLQIHTSIALIILVNHLNQILLYSEH